ncbi:MAG: ComEC/Rec2 family competence protein [Acidimicrobiales bacterium]|nr:ComEC/Rec2 family competence protein [Acidimicrobiales bacterium]MCB9395743.1 ComEC/Rec2 family competence protein [Acidimicrobiaceae bacterium]
MSAAYETEPRRWRQPWTDAEVWLLAGAVVPAVWLGRQPLVAVCWAIVVVAVRRSPRRVTLALGAGVLSIVGAARSEQAWRDVEPRQLGDFAGWARLASDPEPVGAGVTVVLEIEGERFRTIAYGSPRRRLVDRQAGDLAEVRGERVELGDGDRWLRTRHVVGRFRLDRVGATTEGAALDRASNRLRDRLRDAASATMGDDDAALFTGLVVGDDVRQRDQVVDRFRAVGLSHLTAVSGQNVAYVISVAGVWLRRLRPWWRLGATWGLIAWFVVLTRVEPSVVRAGVMAGLGALAVATGRDRSVPRLLALTVAVLTLVDPLLVWSVGFWLSCGATAGVSIVGPWLVRRWRGPVWLALPLSSTVGAQIGVLVPSVVVFGRMPALGVVANLLAIPVAGFVMLVGMPAALLASVVPGAVATVVMAPAAFGTHWVATVAELAERFAPEGAAATTVWAVQVVLALWWWRRPRAGHDETTMNEPSRIRV